MAGPVYKTTPLATLKVDFRLNDDKFDCCRRADAVRYSVFIFSPTAHKESNIIKKIKRFVLSFICLFWSV